MLGFPEVMTKEPATLGPEHANALREAGVTHEAADDAVMIAFVFNLIVRVADSLDFEVPSEEAFRKQARFLLKGGYA